MDAEELETDTQSWERGYFVSRSDWYTNGATVSVTLLDLRGVYCAEEVCGFMAAAALSPSSPIIIVIWFHFVKKIFLKHRFFYVTFFRHNLKFQKHINLLRTNHTFCIQGQVCLDFVFEKLIVVIRLLSAPIRSEIS